MEEPLPSSLSPSRAFFPTDTFMLLKEMENIPPVPSFFPHRHLYSLRGEWKSISLHHTLCPHGYLHFLKGKGRASPSRPSPLMSTFSPQEMNGRVSPSRAFSFPQWEWGSLSLPPFSLYGPVYSPKGNGEFLLRWVLPSRAPLFPRGGMEEHLPLSHAFSLTGTLTKGRASPSRPFPLTGTFGDGKSLSLPLSRAFSLTGTFILLGWDFPSRASLFLKGEWKNIFPSYTFCLTGTFILLREMENIPSRAEFSPHGHL